jgi:peptidoglycan/LPS O-acetylase OafA/YrhL
MPDTGRREIMSEAASAVRAPSQEGYLPALDGVRAIAILLVLLVHCVRLPIDGTLAWALRHTLSNGWIGVDLFFVLSGFLITGILLRAKESPHFFRDFYARRFLRILPPYYLLLLVMLLFAPAFGLGNFAPSWPYFAYLSNWTFVFGPKGWQPLDHAWSLAIEEQFYLVYPFAVWSLRTGAMKRLLWATLLLAPLARVASTLLEVQGGSYFLTVCRLDVLAMGGLVALYLHERGTFVATATERRRIAIAFGIAMSVVILMWVTGQLDFRTLLFSAAGLSIVDAACALFLCLVLLGRPGRLQALLAAKPMVAIGRISYGLYLYHYPVLFLVDSLVADRFGATWARTLLTAPLSIGATLLLAALSFRFFERPILDLKRYFSASSRPLRKQADYAPT